MLPDYFFTVAASSTGKYHPKYALGNGGLVRHTKAADKFAYTLLQLEQYNKFSSDEKDMIIASLTVHDGRKHGMDGSSFTVAEHPTLCADWMRDEIELKGIIPDEYLKIICDAVASHMGEWNQDFKSKKEILPKPQTEIQKFVHICDYLASRKWLPVEFDDNYYDGSYKPVSEVDNTIADIITECKTKITNGVDRDSVYGVIQDIAGVKNPNKITDMNIALNVLKKIKDLTA